MPFGAGPRVCPGRHLAALGMKMVLAMLLGSFEMDSVDTPTVNLRASDFPSAWLPFPEREAARERNLLGE